MTPCPITGPEDSLPATLGGPGWQPRTRSHAEDLQEGALWLAVGVSSEVAPLRDVILAWPGEELNFPEDPNDLLMLERVDLETLRHQTDAVAAAFRAHGVRVHLARPSSPPPPNFLFMRDLFFMTPEGAMLGRMAARQRAGEERFAAEVLACAGVPVLRATRGRGTFEGADALWLDEQTVLVGTGRRTNVEGVGQLASLLGEMGIQALAVELPAGVQHLLGVCNFVDKDLAVVDLARRPRALCAILEARGVRTLGLSPSDELSRRRAMNFVTLAPRRLLMPAHCPVSRARYEAEGIECFEVDVGEYLKAAGALGCLTGVLRRQW